MGLSGHFDHFEISPYANGAKKSGQYSQPDNCTASYNFYGKLQGLAVKHEDSICRRTVWSSSSIGAI